MNYTDLQLAEIETQALFVHDEEGYLLRSNEPDPEDPAPRFFLSRTRDGNLWRTRYDLPPGLANALEELAAKEPTTNDLRTSPVYIDDYVKLLEQHAPITDKSSGPAYYLPVLPMPTGAVLITHKNASLLQTHYPYTMSHLAERDPVVVAVNDGKAVALCCTVRLTHQAVEAGVGTEPGYRGRGYAALVTQTWAAYVRATNRLPLYSTDWDNLASQAVARKLGAVQYANTLSLY